MVSASCYAEICTHNTIAEEQAVTGRCSVPARADFQTCTLGKQQRDSFKVAVCASLQVSCLLKHDIRCLVYSNVAYHLVLQLMELVLDTTKSC